MRCPSCGGYGFDWEDRCSNCGYSILSQKPPGWWGSKDFQSPEKTPPYGEKVKKERHPDETDLSEGSEPELHDCPHCMKHSLFWNKHNHMYECLNVNCGRRFKKDVYETKEGDPATSEQSSEFRDAEVPGQTEERYWDETHAGVAPAKKYCFIHSHYYQLECEFCRAEKQPSRKELTGEQLPHEEYATPKVRVGERLEKCPLCGQGMLRWNPAISKYECLNWKCGRTITKENFQSARSLKERIRPRLPTFNTISRVSTGLLIVAVFTFIFLYGLTDFGHSGRSAIPVASPTPTSGTSGIVAPVNTLTLRLTPTPTPITTPAPNPAGCIGGVCTYDGKQPPYARTGFGYDKIQLVENPNATDPTWLQLKAFIAADKTDEKLYTQGIYMCGAFAEDVHNNAEAAGIKAAWVSIDFQDGGASHALNAFETTDKGLVYVDCTSSRDAFSVHICHIDPSTGRCISTNEEPSNYDKVAYISTGREYGLISLSVATGSSYSDYQNYCQQKNAYDTALAQYNSALDKYDSDLTIYNTDCSAYESLYSKCGGYATAGACQTLPQLYNNLESQRLQLDSQYSQLDNQRTRLLGQEAALGDLWITLGVVSRVEIYW